MNLVDSSAWLEYFADGPNAEHFARAIEATNELVVPTVILFEVFRRVSEQRGHDAALQGASAMQQGQLVDLDATLALSAAQLGHQLRLPLAGAVILGPARRHDATLWTQDADLRGLPGVKYRAKG